jgi:hypothetical protein
MDMSLPWQTCSRKSARERDAKGMRITGANVCSHWEVVIRMAMRYRVPLTIGIAATNCMDKG